MRNLGNKLVLCGILLMISPYLNLDMFETIEFAYRGNIQVYLVVSMAFLTVFLKQISNDFEGTPIVTLYGEAASGKSNLLRLVASAFGLDKSVLHGGMDTLRRPPVRRP